jgi:hypothetical protein
MRTHVTVLGVLQILLGVLGVLTALFFLVMFGGAAGLVSASAQPDEAAFAVPIIGVVGTGLSIFILALSIPSVIVGIGLLRFRPWARILGIVLSILLLIHVPIGTALGVYGLWVLLQGATEKLFEPGAGA